MDDYSSEDDSPPRIFNPEEDSPFTESEIQNFLLREHSVKPIFRNPKHLDIDYIGMMVNAEDLVFIDLFKHFIFILIMSH
jgi:hypothetical protein